MNVREFDEKIRMKQELVAKMQEEIDKRVARLEKVNSEIEQIKIEKKKFVGGYVMQQMLCKDFTDEQTQLFLADLDNILDKFKNDNSGETAKSETVPVSENSKSDYAPYSETETFEDEQEEELEETVEEEQTVTEDFETDDTSGYANSFYQQGRNYYRNNNS